MRRGEDVARSPAPPGFRASNRAAAGFWATRTAGGSGRRVEAADPVGDGAPPPASGGWPATQPTPEDSSGRPRSLPAPCRTASRPRFGAWR